MLFFNFHSMVHDKTGPDREKLDRRNPRQQPIKFKDSGFRTGKMLKKKIIKFTSQQAPPGSQAWAQTFDPAVHLLSSTEGSRSQAMNCLNTYNFAVVLFFCGITRISQS